MNSDFCASVINEKIGKKNMKSWPTHASYCIGGGLESSYRDS